MVSLLICEDVPAEALQLETAIHSVAAERDLPVDMQRFTCGEHLLLNYVRGEADLAFIDVMLGAGIDGMETARQLRAIDEGLPIVFVTSSPEFALQSYDVQALHYLIKPATAAQVRSVFDRCEGMLRNRRRSVELTSNRAVERVLVRDIVYAEVQGNRTTVHTRERSIESYTPLSQIAEQADGVLLRCHRSFVVNMNHIRRVQGREFIMDNDERVPIRTNGASQVIAHYQEFLGRDL